MRSRGRGPCPGARGTTRRSAKPRAQLAPVRRELQCAAQCTPSSGPSAGQRLHRPPDTRAAPVPERLLLQPAPFSSSQNLQQPEGTFGAIALAGKHFCPTRSAQTRGKPGQTRRPYSFHVDGLPTQLQSCVRMNVDMPTTDATANMLEPQREQWVDAIVVTRPSCVRI